MFVNRSLVLSALFLVCMLGSAQQSAQSSAAIAVTPSAKVPHPAIAANYGKLPLAFEANRGQVDSRVRFTTRGSGYSLFLTDKEAVLALSKGGERSPRSPRVPAGASPRTAQPRRDVVRMQLFGAAAGLKVSGDDKLPGTANYFIGNDPAKWHSNVPTYGKVRYDGVYPGVDLVYYGNQSQLEYDFVVTPYADTKQIRLHFAGARRLKLDTNGDLEVVAKNGEIAFHKPVAYQQEGHRREPVRGKFSLLANNTVGFSLDTYDKSRALVIDPTLAYSTYLSGGGTDVPAGVAVDSQGSAYVIGSTSSNDFPVTGAFQSTNLAFPKDTCFITKFSGDGSALVYSTYLGGSGNIEEEGDLGQAIAVDSSGSAYVTGYTYSNDFPLMNSYQSTNKAFSNYLSTPFVSKLNPAGNGLMYSTYIGGSSSVYGALKGDQSLGIAVDAAGSAYITGVTYSTDFPISEGAFQTVNKGATTYQGNAVGFVTKLGKAGNSILYSTFLGGSGVVSEGAYFEYAGDGGHGIVVDGSGDAYVTGAASSDDFPVTSGAYQTVNNAKSNHSSNAFVTKLNTSGSGLVYSTYLGGGSVAIPINSCNYCQLGDGGSAIALDGQLNAYVSGGTYSIDFPVTTGAFQTTNKAALGLFESDPLTGFVSKLNTSGSSLVYSTYLGGTTKEVAYGLAVDATGDAFVTGFTYSSDFPVTPDAYQATNPEYSGGAPSAFVSELNMTGQALIYSTFLGGSEGPNEDDKLGDLGNSLALDTSGGVYLTGSTASSNFPVTPNAFESQAEDLENGFFTGFVTKFSVPSGTATALTADQNPQSLGGKVTFTADVTPSTGSGVPTGTIGFAVDGGTPIVVTLDGTGHASYATSSLTAGAHTVVATYSGDNTYAASTSATLSETILGSAASIGLVSGSSQTATYGASFASPLVVIVKDSNGNPLSGISVSFSGNGLSFSSNTATTGSNGEASVMASAIAAGNLTATASTSGVTGTASFTLTATQVPLTVTAANASVAYNQPIPTLTYSITGFVNGDTSSALTGTPSETTTATKGSAVGTYPITITQGTFASSNYSFTFMNGTLTVTSLGTVATPAFSSAAGTYTSAQTVTITDATAGATIYYTTNGTAPTTSSTKYTSPITVNSSETVEAIAVAAGYTNSTVASAIFVINLSATATPVISPSGGTYTASQTVTISDATSGASIYYTTNGTAPSTTSTLYTGAITVSSTETIEAIAVATDYTASAVASAAYTITPPTATPVISPAGGTYTSAQTVTMTDTTSGATIYYTTNATVPTTSSTVYSGAITVSASETVEAIAVATGYSNSSVATAAYTINLPAASAPTFSPAAGTYTSTQTVTISDATTGATIYYTLDGSTPNASSTKYTSAVSVGSSETINALAEATGYTNSSVATAVYTITIPPPVVATPTYSPAGGTYTAVQTVTIADATAGATIYYTLDGSTPSASSTKYSGPISVGGSETITAIAEASGDTNSAAATAIYTISLPAASFTLAASPSNVSVTSGQSASVTLTVTPENGFTSPVAFACSGLPTGATCSFSPATVTPAGAAVTSALTITTSTSAEIRPLRLWMTGGGGICVALILWPFRRRRGLVGIAYVVFLLIAGGAMLGCGGGSSGSKTTSTTYPAIVTATGGGATQTVSVSLNVTN